MAWFKSSFSDGSSGGNECVEMAPLPDGGVAVRHSTLGDASPILHYTRAEFRAWVLGAKNGEFDHLI